MEPYLKKRIDGAVSESILYRNREYSSVNSNSLKACLQLVERLRFHLFKIELYARRIAEGQTNSFKIQR